MHNIYTHIYTYIHYTYIYICHPPGGRRGDVRFHVCYAYLVCCCVVSLFMCCYGCSCYCLFVCSQLVSMSYVAMLYVSVLVSLLSMFSRETPISAA